MGKRQPADLERCRREARDLERDRAQRAARIKSFFGAEVAADPLADVEARLDDLRQHQERAERASAQSATEAKAATEARRRATEAGADGIRLVAALRAMPVAGLVERARAALSGLVAARAFTSGVPADPSEAMPVAREWAAGASDLLDAARRAADLERATMADLLAQARASVPEGVDVEGAASLEDLSGSLTGPEKVAHLYLAHQVRNAKPETRDKPEARNPKQ